MGRTKTLLKPAKLQTKQQRYRSLRRPAYIHFQMEIYHRMAWKI